MVNPISNSHNHFSMNQGLVTYQTYYPALQNLADKDGIISPDAKNLQFILYSLSDAFNADGYSADAAKYEALANESAMGTLQSFNYHDLPTWPQ